MFTMEISREEDPNSEARNDSIDQIQSLTITNTKKDQNPNLIMEEINLQEVNN